jgi:protein-disulfide isomerase
MVYYLPSFWVVASSEPVILEIRGEEYMARPVQSAKNVSARPPGRPSAAKKRNDRQWLLFALVGAAVVIVVGLILLNSRALNQTPVASGQVSLGLSWGPANAPVKIVEFSNFGCSHCRDFAADDGKRLREEYEGTGKVRFDFMPFSLGSAEPDDAANAAICAADQGRFWDYHDLLFARQGVSADAFSAASLKQYGQQLGLDAAKFNACVDSVAHDDKVHQTSKQGTSMGVNATPTIFVNNDRVVGAVPYDQLKAKIDAAVKAMPAS